MRPVAVALLSLPFLGAAHAQDGAGTAQVLTLGTNLSVTGTTLNAAGGAGNLTAPVLIPAPTNFGSFPMPIFDLGVQASADYPGMFFETDEGLAPFYFGRVGTSFTGSLGTFFDDVSNWSFNRVAGGTKVVEQAASFGFQIESDYINGTTHAQELNLDMTTSVAETVTFSGTVDAGGTMSLTATVSSVTTGTSPVQYISPASYAGFPHTVSWTATSGDTASVEAAKAVTAINADSTFSGLYYADSIAGVVYIHPQSTLVSTWAGSVGSSTGMTIALSTWTQNFRAWAYGWDRDRGADGNGYAYDIFTIGSTSGASYFLVRNATHQLFNVDGNTNYVSIGDNVAGSKSQLVMASPDGGQITVQNGTALDFHFGNGYNLYFRNNGQVLFGASADTGLARVSSGVFQVQALGGSAQGPHLGFYGVSPTVGSSACGEAPSIASGSTDSLGRITVGSSPGSTCIILFQLSYNNVPVCFSQNETTGTFLGSTPTVSGLTMRGPLNVNDKVSWSCLALQQ